MRGIEQYLQVDAATLGALKYAGTWNASTNTPTLTSGVGTQGQYYVVSVAGSTNLDGETNWQVGDWAVFNGSVWQKVDGGSTGLLTTLTVTGNTSLSTTSGSVAIGATSATGKFAVVVPNSGALQLAGNFTNNADADFSLSIKSGETWIGPSTATPLIFANSANTERMRITAAGDVGIGTSSPAQKLDVQGATNPTIKVRNITPGVGNYSQLYLDTNNTFFGAGAAYLRAISENAGNSAVSLALGVNANGGGAPSEAMRITSAGTVGIGTSSPAGTLHVYGSGTTQAVLTSGDQTTTYLRFINTTNNAGYVGYTSDNLIFLTGSSERMRIDASGNLGLGGTPDAWVAGSRALQLGATGYTALSQGTGGDSNLTSNVYLSAVGTWTAIASLGASRYQLDFGAHKWFNAPSGTAGNVISFTQAMTLDASGNLGVGTTSPSSFGIIVAKKDQTADTAISVSNQGTVNAATSMSFTLNEAGTPQGWLRRYRDGTGNTEVGFSDALLFTGSVTGTKTERLRITSAGNIHTPAGATTMTNGFIYIPAAAGVPTGVPTAITGTVPMYYDTTNNKFYVYNGAWKSVTLT